MSNICGLSWGDRRRQEETGRDRKRQEETGGDRRRHRGKGRGEVKSEKGIPGTPSPFMSPAETLQYR